jgi:hypothetical protein
MFKGQEFLFVEFIAYFPEHRVVVLLSLLVSEDCVVQWVVCGNTASTAL